MADMIVATGLRKQFGRFEAVRGIDLRVPAGQVLGFLGPNGAGKSTTMRMLTGFLEPSAGSVELNRVNLAQRPMEAKRSVGYLPEGAPAWGEMRVCEFLRFVARARGYRGSEAIDRADEAMVKLNLGPYRMQVIETLSKGYKRRTGLAQALLHDPPILVLDEPTDGLDPNQKHEVRQLIRKLGGERAVVLSTHILEEVEAVCTRAVIINEGRIVFDGTPAELDARAPREIERNRLDHVFRLLTTTDTARGAGERAAGARRVGAGSPP